MDNYNQAVADNVIIQYSTTLRLLLYFYPRSPNCRFVNNYNQEVAENVIIQYSTIPRVLLYFYSRCPTAGLWITTTRRSPSA